MQDMPNQPAGNALPPLLGVRRFFYANLYQASHVGGLRCQNVLAQIPLNQEREAVRVFIQYSAYAIAAMRTSLVTRYRRA